ncbi:MAG: 16S rRNA processing protein RimM [Ponticaulis sp.]|nr:16S rRNA processing protein RimM [Ponticaulis sp.]
MSDKSNLVCVGAIAGAHGVQGELRIRSFTLVPEDCFAYGPLLDDDGKILVEPKSARPAKTHFVVRPEGNRSREDWEAMKGTKLFVPRDELPAPEEDEFYYDDLLGLSVRHMDGRELGRVKAVQNFGADDLLEIVAPDGRTAYYLPFTKDVVPVVRLAEKELLAEPDEALLPEVLQLAPEA